MQILRRFYPPDVYITETNIIAGLTESFPGAPVRPGDRGFDVQVMQTYLNRIRRNFPLIPTIPASETNEAIYGPITQQAVRTFQQVFSLPQTGIIDRATWFRISQIFVAVARLAELDGEGHTLGIGTVPPNAVLRQGSSGRNVVMLQYILDFLTQFHPVITPIRQDGNFGPGTAQSVRDFQGMIGLTQDGVVGTLTWRALYDAYWGARNAGAGRPPVTPPQPPPPPPTGTFNYTVVSGDTLWLLAQRFGTTVDTIRQLNSLTSDALSIGQVLRIPGSSGTTPPPTGTFNYTVVSGDTLWLLAQRFGTTVDTIRQLNNLTSDALSIGQVLRIPGSGGTTPPPPPTTGSFNYTVRSGDTLWILAQRFGTTDSAIRALNGLTSNNLSVGQVLRIPGNAIQYTVVAGDNLWILSQRFGVPGDRIRAFNNLPNNNLSIGQVLLIPQ